MSTVIAETEATEVQVAEVNDIETLNALAANHQVLIAKVQEAIVASAKKGEFKAIQENMAELTRLNARLVRISNRSERLALDAKREAILAQTQALKVAVDDLVYNYGEEAAAAGVRSVSITWNQETESWETSIKTVAGGQLRKSQQGTTRRPRRIYVLDGHEMQARHFVRYCADKLGNERAVRALERAESAKAAGKQYNMENDLQALVKETGAVVS